jgi:hypothetical protein
MLIIKILGFKCSIIVLQYIGKRSKPLKITLVGLFLISFFGHKIHNMIYTRDKFFVGFMGHKL